jgi:hypothetical protein
MADQSRDAGAGFESGERKLVDGDRRQPDQRHAQRVVVEQRDTEQRQCEQDEVDGDPPALQAVRWQPQRTRAVRLALS